MDSSAESSPCFPSLPSRMTLDIPGTSPYYYDSLARVRRARWVVVVFFFLARQLFSFRTWCTADSINASFPTTFSYHSRVYGCRWVEERFNMKSTQHRPGTVTNPFSNSFWNDSVTACHLSESLWCLAIGGFWYHTAAVTEGDGREALRKKKTIIDYRLTNRLLSYVGILFCCINTQFLGSFCWLFTFFHESPFLFLSGFCNRKPAFTSCF